MNLWDRVDAMFSRIEKLSVAIFLSAMILVAFLQIVLRNFFSTGLFWGDPLVRYLVLWVGFTGAALATREGKHINIDLLSRWFSGKAGLYLQIISHLASTVVCGLLAFAALKFVYYEAQMGDTAFLEIPTWVLQLIIPVTFIVMTLRFFLSLFKALSNLMRPDFNLEHEKKI